MTDIEFALKHITKYKKDFANNSKIMAQIIEHYSAIQDGEVYVDLDGHDQVNFLTGERTEVKSTNYIMDNSCFRIQNLKTKMNNCEYIKIYEYSLGLEKARIFKVPSKEFFNKGHFYGDYNDFRWSASYNKHDSVQVGNTQLLLKYEVTK